MIVTLAHFLCLVHNINLSSCEQGKKSQNLCKNDPDTPIRFYEINIRATDYGGNVGSETLTVIIVPKSADDFFFHDNETTSSFFIEMIGTSRVRHLLTSKTIKVAIA